MADIRHLSAGDAALIPGMLSLFSTAFDAPEDYDARRPSDAYLTKLLANDGFIALVAMDGHAIVGALAAYELRKFEQERSELYIYDLAVAETHRRRGIATTLIAALKRIAIDRGAWVMFVQADHGDEPAIALYSRSGRREDVLHFDIAPI